MRLRIQQFQFLFIISLELLFFPFLYLFEWFKNKISSNQQLKIKKNRKKVISNEVYVNIHEWGGYVGERTKTIKNGKVFNCGLTPQLNRFLKSNDKIKKKIYLTISDIDLIKDRSKIEKDIDVILSVDNVGMDFSGYSEFYSKIKDQPNAYVILSNSSVNAIQTDFLENYINYMETNPDVGILGVSYCSKIWQSIVRNNFNPHLQSFFLLTTINVLKEIVIENGNKFPGKGIVYKRLLIKNGEIAMSRLAQKVGYNLAVTLEDGSVFKFGKNDFFDNGYNRWMLEFTDVRLMCANPNIINEIRNV